LDALDALFSELAASLDGVHFEIGPQKHNVRLFEKARLSHKNNLRRVTDYERRSFVCKSFGGVVEVFNRLITMVTIIRIKNRFAKGNKDAKDSGGYRDLQLVLRLENGTLLETQLHLGAFHDLKTKVAGVKDTEGQSGHERCIIFRQLKEQAVFSMGKSSKEAELGDVKRELEQKRLALSVLSALPVPPSL
jgi:hypothetical protein